MAKSSAIWLTHSGFSPSPAPSSRPTWNKSPAPATHSWRADSVSREAAEHPEKKKTPASESLRVFASPRENFAYSDIPGFCKSTTTAEIAAHGHVLTPVRCVGDEEVEDDGDPFEEKLPPLVAGLHSQFAESAKLESQIRANLKGLGFGVCP